MLWGLVVVILSRTFWPAIVVNRHHWGRVFLRCALRLIGNIDVSRLILLSEVIGGASSAGFAMGALTSVLFGLKPRISNWCDPPPVCLPDC